MANQDKIRIVGGTLYSLDMDASSAARVLDVPSRLPEEQQEPVRTQKVREKVVIKPFAVLGYGFALLVILATLMGYVHLFESKTENAQLTKQLQATEAENTRLRSDYASMVDYDQIDLYATAHGMKKSKGAQTVYVTIPRADEAKLKTADDSDILEQVWRALVDGFKGLLP